MNDETENNPAAPEPTHVEANEPVVVEPDPAPVVVEEPDAGTTAAANASAPIAAADEPAVVAASEVAASTTAAHGLLSEIENGLEELLHSPFALVAFVKGKIAEVRKYL